MKIAYLLVIFAMAGLIIPVYGQNSRVSEEQKAMNEEIRICKEKVDEQKGLTYADKVVAKRNCEREVTIKYNNVDIDYQNAGEMRAKIQDMERCENWYQQYLFLTEEQFKIQKNVEIVKNCIMLYKDPIWDYDGEDRQMVLIEKLDEMKEKLKEITPEPITIDIPVQNQESKIIKSPMVNDNVAVLKERIKQLEDEIERKDAIIKEQLKTIMDLFNRIKNVLFSSFDKANFSF